MKVQHISMKVQQVDGTILVFIESFSFSDLIFSKIIPLALRSNLAYRECGLREISDDGMSPRSGLRKALVNPCYTSMICFLRICRSLKLHDSKLCGRLITTAECGGASL
jgi:hypothetical protein